MPIRIMTKDPSCHAHRPSPATDKEPVRVIALSDGLFATVLNLAGVGPEGARDAGPHLLVGPSPRLRSHCPLRSPSAELQHAVLAVYWLAAYWNYARSHQLLREALTRAE